MALEWGAGKQYRPVRFRPKLNRLGQSWIVWAEGKSWAEGWENSEMGLIIGITGGEQFPWELGSIEEENSEKPAASGFVLEEKGR